MKDGDGRVTGVNFSAFELRNNETYLSTSCLENAAPTRVAALARIKEILAGKLKIKGGVLTIGVVSKIKETFLPHRVRVTCEPSRHDETYSAVRQLPIQRRAALERLAAETWADWHRIDDIQ